MSDIPKVTVLNAKKTTSKRSRTTNPTSRIDVWGADKAHYVRFSFKVENEAQAESIIDSLYKRGAIDWSYIHGFRWPENKEKGLEAKMVIHGLARATEKSFDWKYFKDTFPQKAFVKTSFYPEGTYPTSQFHNKLAPAPAQPNLEVLAEGQVTEPLDEENSPITL